MEEQIREHEAKMARRKRQSQPVESTKLDSVCRSLAEESFKCSEKFGTAGCGSFFDAYRKCSKDERARIIEARKKQLGN